MKIKVKVSSDPQKSNENPLWHGITIDKDLKARFPATQPENVIVLGQEFEYTETTDFPLGVHTIEYGAEKYNGKTEQVFDTKIMINGEVVSQGEVTGNQHLTAKFYVLPFGITFDSPSIIKKRFGMFRGMLRTPDIKDYNIEKGVSTAEVEVQPLSNVPTDVQMMFKSPKSSEETETSTSPKEESKEKSQSEEEEETNSSNGDSE